MRGRDKKTYIVIQTKSGKRWKKAVSSKKKTSPRGEAEPEDPRRGKAINDLLFFLNGSGGSVPYDDNDMERVKGLDTDTIVDLVEDVADWGEHHDDPPEIKLFRVMIDERVGAGN